MASSSALRAETWIAVSGERLPTRNAMSAEPDAEFVAAGRIGPARGVRGDVFVEPWTDDPAERFAAGSVLHTEPAAAGPLTVESANLGGSKLVIHFAGVDDRTGAAALHGVRLLVAASARPPIEDPDEFYASDLVGLSARDASGMDYGPVRDVLNLAGAEYLVLDVDGREQLVPFVAAIVPTVDVAGGVIVIDPPDGLFDQ